jgi:hypothetical protein
VKHLKDCAFPLPMNAVGGCTQSFESFEGALLDVVSVCTCIIKMIIIIMMMTVMIIMIVVIVVVIVLVVVVVVVVVHDKIS